MNPLLLFSGLLLLGAVLLWPRRGFVAMWRAARRLAERTRIEDALKHILKEEVNGRSPTVAGVAGVLGVAENAAAPLLADLARRGLITFEGGQMHLRESGRELAGHVIRAHRLWESYLADQTGLDEREWHRRAERQEHLLSPQDTEKLAARLGHPLRDPHGDAIPQPGGDLAADSGQSLNAAEVNQPLEIVHLEDEPMVVYDQLLDLGLRPGMKAVISRRTADSILLHSEGRDIEITPVQAQNISVAPVAEDWRELIDRENVLAGLAPGGRGTVLGLAAGCRGPERRRLLDLGFVPGTVVEVEMVSPNGDPTAYRVRGAVIALRREQAALIRIEPLEQAA